MLSFILALFVGPLQRVYSDCVGLFDYYRDCTNEKSDVFPMFN